MLQVTFINFNCNGNGLSAAIVSVKKTTYIASNVSSHSRSPTDSNCKNCNGIEILVVFLLLVKLEKNS